MRTIWCLHLNCAFDHSIVLFFQIGSDVKEETPDERLEWCICANLIELCKSVCMRGKGGLVVCNSARCFRNNSFFSKHFWMCCY